MQVTSHKAYDGEHTKYILEAVIEGQRYRAQYIPRDSTYAALDPKDVGDLIESQLWKQLMHNIEQQLRKTAYAQTQDTHR